MDCPRCPQRNPDDARFCLACGAPFALRCASCGAELPPAARFCFACGRPLGGDPANADGTDRSASDRTPLAYTPKHLADKILASKSALEGERKQVTVLFADVKGSLELAESVDPEAWHGILDRFFQILADGVHRFEGSVNQYTGDGIMALFGAPLAHEDHAQRACYAALHLREELRRYADALRVERGLSFSVRMGLNSGDVVVGKIGDDLRMDYTAQGPVVGIAQRMEQLAEPGTVCVAEATARLVSGFFALRELGPLAIKGLAAPLRVAVLEGTGPLRTRLDVSRTRGLSRFVGRADELATLEAALARALAGQGQVVGIVAEAGTGKSRLCLELSERCQARGIRVGIARAVSHGKAIPLLPILELFRDYFGVSERDTAQAAREKIAGRLLLLDRALDDCLPLLFDFLGIGDPSAPPPAAEGDLRQRQLFAIVQRLMRARSAREPSVMIFEDLHWIDPASEAFLEKLVEFAAGTRTLVVTNFRPEYRGAWTGRSHVQQIALSPLGPAELDALLGELLGPEAAASGLAAKIRERTGGNPFFIEEVVVSLAESGALAGSKGRYRLAAAVENIALPATVKSLLAARIDRLAEREKQVLQTAAVIGPEFREAILRSVVDLPEGELAGALDRLVQAELLYEQELYPEREYAFKHPLTQEVAYGTQLAERRARTHARVARALEQAAPEKLEERAALLAHHCEAAGEALAAARWHHVAANRASERRLSDAVLHLRRAIALLDSAPETPEGLALGAETRSSLLAAAVSQPISEEEIERLREEASELARRSGDAQLAVLVVLAHRWIAVSRGGDLVAVERDVEQALAAAEQLGDLALQLRAWLSLTVLRLGSGSFEGALRAGDRALELFEALGERSRGVPWWGMRPALVLVVRGSVLLQQGRLAEARAEFERALRVSEERGDLVNVSVVNGSIAMLAETLGDAGLARASALRARDTAAQTGSTTGLVLSEHGWGIASFLAGDIREAAAAHARALEQIRASNTVRTVESEVLGKLAHAHARLGDPLAREESLAAVRLPSMRRPSAQLDRARVLRILDGLAARREIEDALNEAERLACELGHRVSLPFVHEERAELARLLGDEAMRARELREAQRLFLEMGAPLRAEQIEARLRDSATGTLGTAP